MSYYDIFPIEEEFNLETFNLSQLKPIATCNSYSIYLKLVEPIIYLRGFPNSVSPNDPIFNTHSSNVLRGYLVLSVIKPYKFKSIELQLSGISKLEWPNSKDNKIETFSIIDHKWSFYDANSSPSHDNATLYRPISNSTTRRHSTSSLSSSSSMFENLFAKSDMANDPTYFQPGMYFYTFQYIIPHSVPESIEVPYGSIKYQLRLIVKNYKKFNSKSVKLLPITIIRSPSDTSIEENEPIIINKDWKSKIFYNIVIHSKICILDGFLPISITMIPMDKVIVHRVRVWITETINYHSTKDPSLHRSAATREYLLSELKGKSSSDSHPRYQNPNDFDNLLESNDTDDIGNRNFEFQVYVPKNINSFSKLHPDTFFNSIVINHWIKISFRVSIKNDDNKLKHFEVSIDSPLHILDKFCSHANILLPNYYNSIDDTLPNIYFPDEIIHSDIMSSETNAMDPMLPVRTDTNIQNYTHFKPIASSKLSSNIYQPRSLPIDLVASQAIPSSPIINDKNTIMSSLFPPFPPPPYDAAIPTIDERSILNEINIKDYGTDFSTTAKVNNNSNHYSCQRKINSSKISNFRKVSEILNEDDEIDLGNFNSHNWGSWEPIPLNH
ncbi:hypothetical protein KAFR_0A03510 [Kazachstania africana CBS 2517]|uniref:Arrestin C-terminal-like domain-containing protein n=1 Tax=Kazachstania africana (strain ATCC 22294 / BCRC 22015 / CBS 2517 / CECT 1963 / NBRC 1671 / NRRL Y-8276) TaxID=1071382 RepID=H2AN36_KAZAF|nr:hypothetical protein KAFR_0A03510 [Kazachstania africana CBS 2517]CCF55786.1 hypothetical protein KAFR_0A03510 [Kazachstania africana CBS 2517]